MNTFFHKYALFLGWIISISATLGSLFFSLVMHLPPCDLCWYQRIALYPMVVILGIGFVRKDKGSILYALPLLVAGWIIAAWHNLLYYKIVPDTLAPCSSGVSCTTKYLEWFGFVTIPLLSLAAFTIIIILLALAKRGVVAPRP